MAAATNYLENALLDHAFGGTTYTQPGSYYVKLHIGDPGEDATSNAASETTRKAVTWAAASGGSKSTSGSPAAAWTGVAASETYSHISIWDDATAGNPLAYGALDSGVAVTIGGNFNLTSVTITLA